ncbi:MAG: helix-turn-helix domain-containing protein [Pseudomonadota bacterium]
MLDIKTLPSPEDPEEALAAVLALRLLADKLERQAVARAIEQGWSWSQIAEALGVSKQAAHKRLASTLHKTGLPD